MLIDLQITVDNEDNLPASQDFHRWAKATFAELGKDDKVELTIRLTDNNEVQQLNRDYRGQNKPTNIYSMTTMPILPYTVFCIYWVMTILRTIRQRQWKCWKNAY